MKKKIEDDCPLPRIIYQTSLNLQAHADQTLNPFDLTVEQFHVLKILYEEELKIPQKKLAELAAKSPASTTKIIDRLSAKDLVERVPSTTDRRVFLISLTDKGVDLITDIKTIFIGYIDEVLFGISVAEQELCKEVLERINSNLQIMIDKNRKQ